MVRIFTCIIIYGVVSIEEIFLFFGKGADTGETPKTIGSCNLATTAQKPKNTTEAAGGDRKGNASPTRRSSSCM